MFLYCPPTDLHKQTVTIYLLSLCRIPQLAMPSKLAVMLVSLLLAIPSVIFWLWLVIIPARVAVLCPDGCLCDTVGIFVQCYNTLFTSIPLIHFTGVRAFFFYENKVKFVGNDSFVSLTELGLLHITRCGLRTIEVGAFNGLRKLTILSMQGNEISELIPGTFEDLNSLLYLGLDRNKIEHLDSAVFSGLVDIQYIHLGDNKLQSLHPNTFLGLPNLQQLNLSTNPTLTIPTDRPFINSHSLLHLNISYCNISSLSVETLANVSALELLDLRYNELETVDINILRSLPKLSALYPNGNPLQCDCQLQEVWRLCEDRNIQTADEVIAPECDTPSEVKGRWWGVLEEGQCLEGNIEYCGDYNSTSYNYTDTEQTYFQEYDAEFFNNYQLQLNVFPFIFGTTLNVILLIIIICNKDMRSVPNMYILNLAVSDIINLTVLFSVACANRIHDKWLTGDFLCAFLPFCRRLSVGMSAYSVAVYSFQRYRVTVDPFSVRVSSHATWRVTAATIFAVWIVAALFAVPSAFSKHTCEDDTIVSMTYYRLVVIFELLVSCVLPLCVVAFSYAMIARHLVENSRPISDGTQNPQLQIRRNTAKIVVGLAFVFLISYVPYHILWTYINYTDEAEVVLTKITDILDESNEKLRYMYLLSTFFLLINSCLNPVALFFTSSPFRQHLKRYLTCFCKTKSPPTDLELRRRK